MTPGSTVKGSLTGLILKEISPHERTESTLPGLSDVGRGGGGPIYAVPGHAVMNREYGCAWRLFRLCLPDVDYRYSWVPKPVTLNPNPHLSHVRHRVPYQCPAAPQHARQG